MELDQFSDMVFLVDQSYIKGNSAILRCRSTYFATMLCDESAFTERDLSKYVVIKGVPKEYFVLIIQFIYSDQFYMDLDANNLEHLMNLQIYADYFMLDRMAQIVSRYICRIVCVENVIQVLKFAREHNAGQLFQFCIQFICLNESAIRRLSHWKSLKSCIKQEV